MITCWRCQRIISAQIDTGTVLPGWARQHLESCPRCRESYTSATAIAQRLSVTADGEKRPPPPFLHGKIMSALRSQQGAAEPQPARARLGWAMALGTACAVAAGMLWLQRPPAHGPIVIGSVSAPARQLVKVNLPSAAQVDQWLKTPEAPLENETQLVLQDARTALNTLAKSFLPENLQASTERAGH